MLPTQRIVTPHRTYTREQLAAEAGIPPSRIQYYRKLRAISPPSPRTGPTAVYTDQHLTELRDILRDRHRRRSLADWAELRDLDA